MSELQQLAIESLAPVRARGDELRAEQERLLERVLEIATELRVLEEIEAAVMGANTPQVVAVPEQPLVAPNENGKSMKPKLNVRKAKGRPTSGQVSSETVEMVRVLLWENSDQEFTTRTIQEATGLSRDAVGLALKVLRDEHGARRVGTASGQGKPILWQGVVSD